MFGVEPCGAVALGRPSPIVAQKTARATRHLDLTQKQKDALAAGSNFHSTINDYQRKRGDFSGFLPPTRVDKLVERAGQREKALRAIGIVV